jgi:FkbM family methyltransferase
MKKVLKRILPSNYYKKLAKIKNEYFDGNALKSYSQEGEDMILRRIFENQKKGFYVDVGAHHPKRFSNTYYFYKRGWSGINIDATPGSMRKFKKHRKRDINLELPISENENTLTYYMFNEPALNCFSQRLSSERIEKGNYKLIDTKKLKTQTLTSVLSGYLYPHSQIDFLSIDVEGLDLSVLKSNDWDKYRPKVVIVEILKNSVQSLFEHDITYFLEKKDFIVFAKTVNSVFFMDHSFYAFRFN